MDGKRTLPHGDPGQRRSLLADLKPYREYKDSGVEWLGEVPAHWEVERLKSCVANVVEQTADRRANDLCVALEHVESWTGRLRTADDNIAFDSQLKRFHAGDVLFGKLRPYLAKVTRPKVGGVCVGEFLVLRPRGPKASAAYLEKLLRSKPVIYAVNSSTFGAKMPRADWQFVGGVRITLPPLPEQAAIVRFLDYVDRRIRRLIRARRRRIELLEEYKQALIHQAVTGRIDVRTGEPYPAYKDSGVEWLGEVPAHWHVVRVGHLIQLTTGFPFKSEGFSRRQEDVRLLRGVNVSPGSLRWEDVVRWPAKERTAFAGFELEVGDIVLGMDRPIISAGIRVASVTAEDLPCLLLQRVARIRPLKGVDARFLLLVFAGQGFKDYLTPIFTGVSVPHLSPEQIRSFRLALPPFEDQVAVIKYIDAATTRSNAVVTNTRRSIALLEELRTRLIADVVTGKLDVREVVKRLPEEDGELEYPDGPDSSSARRPGQEDDLLETAGIGPEAVP